MKTLASTSYNPDGLLCNNTLLKLPLQTIISRIDNGEIDLNKRFKRNHDTLWHVLAAGHEKEHADKLKAIIIRYFSTFKLADLNSLNEDMLTPIQIAALHGNLDTISVFISFGADPTTHCLSKVCPGGTLEDLFKISGQRGLKQLKDILENYQGIQALQQQQPYDRLFIQQHTFPRESINKNLKKSLIGSIYTNCRQILFSKQSPTQQDETVWNQLNADESSRPLNEKKEL